MVWDAALANVRSVQQKLELGVVAILAHRQLTNSQQVLSRRDTTMPTAAMTDDVDSAAK